MKAGAYRRPGQPTSAGAMYRALVGVGVLCGLVIVTVYEVTKPVIAENRAVALQQAVFTVLGEAKSSRAFVYDDAEGFRVASGASGQRVFAGYDEDGRLVGLALEAVGMGYQDAIRVLYGYSFESQAVVGLRVLESKETPGLGDKIEKDPHFLANFEQLDVQLTEDGGGLRHEIEIVKRGDKTEGWQIDGISGATISSVAIGRMLARSAARWIPIVEQRRGDFGRGEANDE